MILVLGCANTAKKPTHEDKPKADKTADTKPADAKPTEPKPKPTETTKSSSTEALVKKIISAYGGPAAIEKAAGLQAKGQIKAPVLGDEGTYERISERPRKLRVETVYKRSSEVRILNGQDGWRMSSVPPFEKVTSFRLQSMVFQYKQLDLPYGLMKGQYRLKILGSTTHDSKKCTLLEITDDEGPRMEALIDPDTNLVVRLTGYFDMAERQATLAVEFRDFRTINGMPLPFSITNYGSGQKIAENIITEYVINPTTKDAQFLPPR